MEAMRGRDYDHSLTRVYPSWIRNESCRRKMRKRFDVKAVPFVTLEAWLPLREQQTKEGEAIPLGMLQSREHPEPSPYGSFIGLCVHKR